MKLRYILGAILVFLLGPALSVSIVHLCHVTDDGLAVIIGLLTGVPFGIIAGLMLIRGLYD